jgi:hypothetical protein
MLRMLLGWLGKKAEGQMLGETVLLSERQQRTLFINTAKL